VEATSKRVPPRGVLISLEQVPVLNWSGTFGAAGDMPMLTASEREGPKVDEGERKGVISHCGECIFDRV
jgi:hypothetical protein